MFMHWGKVACIPVHMEMTVCWFLSILLLLACFLFSSTKQLRKITTTTGWSVLWPNLITGKERKWQGCPKIFHVHEKGNNDLRKERGVGCMRKEKKTR